MPEEITTSTIQEGDDLIIDVIIGFHTDICFKVSNVISSLKECNVLTWFMSKGDWRHIDGINDKVPFYLKIKSDSNKEQWARILARAFDDKERGKLYPWTLIVAKVAWEIDRAIQNKKQDFLATEIEGKEPTWILEPFIQENQINTLFGLGSSGKTLLSLYFAKFVAIEKGINILFVDYEDCQEGWKFKLQKISSLNEMNDCLDKFVYFASEQIPLAEQVDKVKEVIKQRNIGLVIIDSASLATGESTSDEKAAVRLVSALKLLNTTSLLIAHQRKNDGDRTPIGSIQYENQSRNVWNVKSNPDDLNSNLLHIALSHTKANNTYLRKEPYGYCVEYTPMSINITRESAKDYFSDKFTVIQRIEQFIGENGESSLEQITDGTGMSKATIAKNLSVGKTRGVFSNREQLWSIRGITPLEQVE